ncbi:acetolactate synthase, large subunit, biosynthetic type [Clostridium sp. W14A]|nr:acetolactate synthase, large subunit, biosynthetic type [Clostridium sp. W14A]
MITGAEIMVKCLESEQVELVFGYPGAAICPFYDSLSLSKIRHVLVRQEQNAAHMASGYARASGKPGVCVATSGPGATNLITGIATAYMDSIPLIAITGQVNQWLLGRDVFQEADITGACESFTKHSYLVKDLADLPRVFKEAFHIASTGRPGPVLIDIPTDVQTAKTGSFTYPQKAEIAGYKPRTQGHAVQVKRAAEAVRAAKRPLIVCGGGVVSAAAREELISFAEGTRIPVVSTMMGLGVMPMDSPLYLGMIGMHGHENANRAIHESDCILLCGARVGDRAVNDPEKITEKATIIHIDVDPAEIGKNMAVNIPIVGDVRLVLKSLSQQMVPAGEDSAWTRRLKQERAEFVPHGTPQNGTGFVEPRSFFRAFSSLLREDAILVSDVGQHQIWAASSFNVKQGRFLTSGGLGTMGYSLPAAVGAKLAKPNRQVICICGDGAFQMSLCELATLVESGAEVKIILMQNTRLGMVWEIQNKWYEGRCPATQLTGDPDFVALAKAYGIRSALADSNDSAEHLAREMLEASGPFLLVCRVDPCAPTL